LLLEDRHCGFVEGLKGTADGMNGDRNRALGFNFSMARSSSMRLLRKSISLRRLYGSGPAPAGRLVV
jgi:hypothetical protein